MDYSDPTTTTVQIGQVTRAEACPASWPRPGPTLYDDPDLAPQLTRWKAVVEAIRLWHETSNDIAEISQQAFGQLDHVQYELCMELFRSYMTMIERDDPIEFDPPTSEVIDSTGGWTVLSWPTAVIRHRDAEPEYVKIRTGKASTSEEEAAVLLAGATEPATFTDLLLATNDQRPIVIPESEQGGTITRLFSVASTTAQTRSTERSRRPGRHCYGCGRAPYCGEYPPVAGQPPGSSARLVTVSKSGLARASRCHRRGGWTLIHRIPEDPRETDSDGELGLAVHRAVDAILSADDPASALEAQLAVFPSSETSDLRLCVDNHLSMDQEHHGPLEYRQRGLQTGVTFVVSEQDAGRTRQTAVVFIAEVDATAREHDGTPAIVEHKTAEAAKPFERDLYAVAGWQLLRRLGHQSKVLAIHHHHLRRRERPRCDRVLFDQESIEAATARLDAVAGRIAGWDPLDALGPPPKLEADGECLHCEFRQRCLRYGGPK